MRIDWRTSAYIFILGILVGGCAGPMYSSSAAEKMIAEQEAQERAVEHARQADAQAQYENYERELSAERAAEEASAKRAAECRLPWEQTGSLTLRLDDAFSTSPSGGNDQSSRLVSATPSKRYRQLEVFMRVELPRLDAAKCPIERRPELEAEWRDLQREEKERQAAYAELLRQQEEEAAREREWARQLEEKAKKRGYASVWWNDGLTGLLNAAIDEAVPVRKLARVAVPISNMDSSFVATQVLGKKVLFLSNMSDARVIMTTSRVYEGSALSTLPHEALVVVGVTSYRTVAGGTAQAFVVKPAW